MSSPHPSESPVSTASSTTTPTKIAKLRNLPASRHHFFGIKDKARKIREHDVLD
jgi:hypothetical protein